MTNAAASSLGCNTLMIILYFAAGETTIACHIIVGPHAVMAH